MPPRVSPRIALRLLTTVTAALVVSAAVADEPAALPVEEPVFAPVAETPTVAEPLDEPILTADFAEPGVADAAPEAAEAVPCRVCCPDLSGTWSSGWWRSASNGHSGKLRATMTRCGPDRYRCTFCGTFFGLIPFRYTTTLYVTGCDESGRVHFRATQKLPLCAGTFSCTGSATRCSFRANFYSAKDRGVFVMGR